MNGLKNQASTINGVSPPDADFMRVLALLRQIQDLTQEGGINLAGVKMIIELQAQLEALRAETDDLQERLREREHEAGSEGKIVPLTSVFLPPWQGRQRP